MPWSNTAQAPQPLSQCSRVHAPQQEKTLQTGAREPQLETTPRSTATRQYPSLDTARGGLCGNKDPAQPKQIKKYFKVEVG